ncbi:MAG: NADH-quinone oxidoreductase subunit A [Flavobacteriales bacterium]|jgi:NADH-quinone oxidoreductase subunit A
MTYTEANQYWYTLHLRSAINCFAMTKGSTRKALVIKIILISRNEVYIVVNYGESLIQQLWPLILYLVLVVGLIIAMLAGPYFLGNRRKARATGEPYECGILPVGTAQYRVPIPFYLFAIFFVIFDLEAVFLYAWSIALKEAGWAGYIEALVFISILLVALIYLWRMGALDWRTSRQKRDRAKVTPR